jgi:hypothetical protein
VHKNVLFFFGTPTARMYTWMQACDTH